ncbi:MAG TPA: 2OG-Fe(II) oxygenase [bacterium]|nr:2OG-Fe(II) oxygenase [bacterium]
MSPLNRTQYADLILQRLEPDRERLRAEFNTPGNIRAAIIDDLLPEPLALELAEAFPTADQMVLHHTLREHKYISAQMNRHDPRIEETLFAFQDPRILRFFGDIMGLDDVRGDDLLYGSGLSLMGEGQVLNPHIDTSHNLAYDCFRVMNLLYYVTPGWQEEWGGNLELYEHGPTRPGRAIHSRFNRLVVMGTHDHSWHGVSPVTHGGQRRCISNYYFSPTPLVAGDSSHVTYFRGRPGERAKDLALTVDSTLRTVKLRAWELRRMLFQRFPMLGRGYKPHKHGHTYQRDER